MTKIAKLSLVAAVAIAGLTNANASALEEAIKGVDISGTAAYRYDDRDSNNSNLTNNSYKVGINLKSKVNEDLTFNTRTIIGDGNGMVSLDTSNSDGEATFALSHVNFVYTGFANTTLIAGKQAVPSPFAVQYDAAGDEDTGTGITGVINLDSITLAGTYLNQTNLEAISGQDVAGLGAMANVGPVALDAWYLEVMEGSVTDSGHQAYTFGAKAKVAIVDMYARYSAIAHDATGADTESLWKIGAKAKMGIVGFGVDYGQTNDVTSSLTGASLTGDADAATSMQAWQLNLENKNDASLLKVSANVQVLPALNLAVTYADYQIDSVANSDANEVYGQATFKMGKNFMTYARLGQTDDDAQTDKGYRGRLHVQYSF